jgi:hypothetical protein
MSNSADKAETFIKAVEESLAWGAQYNRGGSLGGLNEARI